MDEYELDEYDLVTESGIAIKKVLLLQYNRDIVPEVSKMFAGKVDDEMYDWLIDKANLALRNRNRSNAEAWIVFLQGLDTNNFRIAVSYIIRNFL